MCCGIRSSGAAFRVHPWKSLRWAWAEASDALLDD